jgi:sugar lactone lactonase YvrE
MNGRFVKIMIAVVLSIAAVFGFMTYCVAVPFPSSHTLGFLSPLMGPFLGLGEIIYQTSADHAVFLAVCAACVGTIVSLMAMLKKKRLFSKALILPAITAAVTAQLLWTHAPAAVSYFLLIAAFVLFIIAAMTCRREQLRDIIPPPTRRNRMLLLLAVLAIGLVFRAYHLDIRPPGDSHHSSEYGVLAAQFAHKFPLDLTSPTKLVKAVRDAVVVFVKQESMFKVIDTLHPEDKFAIYHVSMTQANIDIFLNRLAFNVWGPHFIIPRAISVVLGVLTLYILFLLAEDLFGTSAGLLAALIMAASPWHNTHSRYSEITFVLTMLCVTLTVLCLVRALQRRSIGWTFVLVLNLAFVNYVYTGAQFIILVAVAFWLYYMVQNRRYWKSLLIVGLVSLALAALLSAPVTHIFGPIENIRFISSPINRRAGYGVQSYGVMTLNAVKLVKSLLIEATDRDCWFKKEGAILLWPMGLLFMGGLAWCLPRRKDSRCVLLVIWFVMGVLPTIPSREVFARRITCAAPAIYILAALFACIVLAPLRRLIAFRSRVARRIVAGATLVLCIAPAFAAFYHHTGVYEEWSHADHRRIAEIVYENIQDYYIYLDYDPHEIIEPVWVYCGKYAVPGKLELPLAFFKEREFTQNILPSLRTGPAGTMFIVPASVKGDALIGLLRARYPGGRHETYCLDPGYFDHPKGFPLCQSYKIPREWVTKGVISEPVMEPQPAATIGPRGGVREDKQGMGPGEYKEPRGIALDPKGNIYVADFRNYRIQKFDAKGRFVTAWGEEGDRPGQFKDPCGVAADGKGRIYVADTFNHRLQVFDESGNFLFQIEGGFFAPRGVCIDRKGRIWVADSGNGVLRLFSRDGKPIKTVGKKGSGRAEFVSPTGIAVGRKGNVYVADTGNGRVHILDGEGNYLSEFAVDGWEEGAFSEPYLDLDYKGDIYLTDPRGNRALRYSRNGRLLGVLGPIEGDKPLLSFPMGIAVEKKGNAVYVVDCRNHRIRKVSKRDFR